MRCCTLGSMHCSNDMRLWHKIVNCGSCHRSARLAADSYQHVVQASSRTPPGTLQRSVRGGSELSVLAAPFQLPARPASADPAAGRHSSHRPTQRQPQAAFLPNVGPPQQPTKVGLVENEGMVCGGSSYSAATLDRYHATHVGVRVFEILWLLPSAWSVARQQAWWEQQVVNASKYVVPGASAPGQLAFEPQEEGAELLSPSLSPTIQAWHAQQAHHQHAQAYAPLAAVLPGFAIPLMRRLGLVLQQVCQLL